MMRHLLLFFVLIFGVTACASMQSYSTGIPATGGDRFFFHMEQEAAERGYATYYGSNGDQLTVTVNGGTLRYTLTEREIVLYTSLKQTNISDAEAQRRHGNLKQLSDDMIEGARARAEDANVFDR